MLDSRSKGLGCVTEQGILFIAGTGSIKEDPSPHD